jgi:prepilin-type processing-associated H-X9-DG protein
LVIAVIAVLAALLLPALAGAKGNARKTYCLNNKRQLALAWLAYAYDNNDLLPNNYLGFGGGPYASEFEYQAFVNWVGGAVDWTANDYCTNLAYLTSETNSSLAAYLGHSAGVYWCPEDSFLSSVQKAAGLSHAIRSVAMNWYLGGGPRAVNAGILLRLSDFVNFPPAAACVFLDGHPDSMSSTPVFFMVAPETEQIRWGQLPGSYHDGGCTLSFADGHEEYKRWLDPQTCQPVRYATWDYKDLNSTDPVDFNWLAARILPYPGTP